jgi:hypothetical protein
MEIEFEPTTSIEQLRALAEQKKNEAKALRQAAKEAEKKQKEQQKQRPKVPTIRIGGPVPKPIVDKAKDICWWHNVSLTELITQGLEHVIEKYKDVPEREGDLKRGRRSSSEVENSEVEKTEEDVQKAENYETAEVS